MKHAKRLYNIYSKEEDLELKIRNEPFTRLTLSFYRYFILDDEQGATASL